MRFELVISSIGSRGSFAPFTETKKKREKSWIFGDGIYAKNSFRISLIFEDTCVTFMGKFKLLVTRKVKI